MLCMNMQNSKQSTRILIIVVFILMTIVSISLLLSINNSHSKLYSLYFNHYHKLTNRVVRAFEAHNDTIVLAELTPFVWDSLFFFSSSFEWFDIQEHIPSFSQEFFNDIGDRLIFTNNGIVVYQEVWFNTDIYPDDFTYISFSPPSNCFVLSKNNAIFSIQESVDSTYRRRSLYLRLISI